jgi:hypothetical protein
VGAQNPGLRQVSPKKLQKKSLWPKQSLTGKRVNLDDLEEKRKQRERKREKIKPETFCTQTHPGLGPRTD